MYLITSCPDEVACSSGAAARRPVMIIRATEREEEELKERAERAPPVAVRINGRRDEAKADMVWLVFGLFAFEQVLGIMVGENKKKESEVKCHSFS